MAKTTQMYMKRRGVRYLIERTSEGTFKRFIPIGKAGKKASAKKVSAKTSSKSSVKKSNISAKRAHA